MFFQSLHKAELLETAYEQLREKVDDEMRQKSTHSSQKQLSKAIVDLTEVWLWRTNSSRNGANLGMQWKDD